MLPEQDFIQRIQAHVAAAAAQAASGAEFWHTRWLQQAEAERASRVAEIEASIPSGAPGHGVRTVTENSHIVKCPSHGFEAE